MILLRERECLLTERLKIERANLKDARFFLNLMNSPGWLKYIGDREIKTVEDAKSYIESTLITSYKENGYGLYRVSLRQSEIPIGICGFLKRDYLEYADLGFAILPKYERKGYIFEAAMEMVKQGKIYFSPKPILAITTEENLPSRNLLIKLGFALVDKINEPKENEELLLYSTN